MVDATIIHAPPSTKNQDKQRDPEMHQTKKGNQWFFGMKVQSEPDVNSGPCYTVSVTPPTFSDISQLPHLVREDDRAVFGDKGYVNNNSQALAAQAGVFWGVSLKASKPSADRREQALQPQDVVDPRAGRARLPRHQAPVRLYKGALQGDRRTPPRCSR